MLAPSRQWISGRVLAMEAEYLLRTQGTGYVLQALGYTKPESLVRRLRRSGQDEIAVIFEEMDHVRPSG